MRGGIASRLLAEACRRFAHGGVTRVRTMVRRNDVPVLSFFRSNGFVGGSFVQLELDLGETRMTDTDLGLPADGPVRVEPLDDGAIWRVLLATPKANIVDMEKIEILTAIFERAAARRPA